MNLFPIAYFGSVSYFQDLLQKRHICFEVQDHFPKQTFRNRMTILSSQGPQILTLPVEKPNGSKTLTKDIRLSRQQNWSTIHWRSIRTAYASAPYFDHYASDIERLLNHNSVYLVDLCEEILNFFIQALSLPLTYSYTENFQLDVENDFRNEDYEVKKMTGKYQQVLFEEKSFCATVSFLDTLFCEGPIARKLLL